jgi:hypothetical protein
MQRGPCHRGAPYKVLGKEVTWAQNERWTPRAISDYGGRWGDQDGDDTGRLSELITLAEVGLQVKEDEDDTSRLSELLALAEACL